MKKLSFSLVLLLLLFSAKIFATGLYVPTIVAPVDSAINQMPNLMFQWNPVAGASYYKIQVDTSSMFTHPIIYSTIYATTSASELSFGTKYYWRIKTMGTSDSSDWSNPMIFTTFSNFKLVSPVNNTTHCTLDTLLKWENDIKGCTYFDYQLDTTVNFNSSLLSVNSVGATNYSGKPSGLHFGLKYYWRVRARHSKDTSAWSLDTSVYNDNWSFTTLDTTKLISPTDSTVKVNPNVKLTWRNYTGLSDFELQTDTTNAFNSPLLNISYPLSPTTGTSFSFNADSLNFSTLYYWRVRSMANMDTTGWSVTWRFVVLSNVTLSAPTSGTRIYTQSATLKWIAVTGISKYELQLDKASGFTSPSIYYPASSATSQAISFTSGGTYYWRVRAILSNRDTSAWSSTWSFYISGVGVNNITLNPSSVNIYPNPTNTNNVSIQINSSENSKIDVSLMDILGKQIKQEEYYVAQGDNVVKLNLEGIDEGIYMLKFTDGNNSFIKKLTISK